MSITFNNVHEVECIVLNDATLFPINIQYKTDQGEVNGELHFGASTYQSEYIKKNIYQVGDKIHDRFVTRIIYKVFNKEIEIDLFLKKKDCEYVQKIRYNGTYTAMELVKKYRTK